MPGRRSRNTTKKEIILTATRMFLERGYSATSIKAISDELGISTGNLTFHFPTKEDLLAVLVQMLYTFHWDTTELAAGTDRTSLEAVCLELPMMAAICEENPIARDFYLNAYMHTKTLQIIQSSDVARAAQVYAPWCPDWTDRDYVLAQILISGIEYATLMSTPDTPPLEQRLPSALNGILAVYRVPAETRQTVIDTVLATDYRQMGRSILKNFITYTRELSEEMLETLFLPERS